MKKSQVKKTTDSKSDKEESTPPTSPKKVVNIRCRQDGCDSITALDVTPEDNRKGHNMYACTKCKKTWGVHVGGGVNF
jgi:hypothetical protein